MVQKSYAIELFLIKILFSAVFLFLWSGYFEIFVFYDYIF